MQRIEPFELLRPRTLDEAVHLLATRERAMVIAGGSDLVPKLKRAQFSPRALVSLSGVEGLDGVSVRDGVLRIGALTRLATLEHAAETRSYTAIHEAAAVVATPIIRGMATVGGNLLQDTRCRFYDRSSFWREATGSCLKLDADVCRVASGGKRCFATFCSDLAPALIVLDARVTIAGREVRTVPLADIYNDDGIAPFRMSNEILTHVEVPAGPRFSRYRKFRIRDSFDFPEVGVAVSIDEGGGRLKVNVALTGVASSVPVFREVVERGRLRSVADTVHAAVKPMDTMFFPPAHRKTVARNFLLRIFDEFLAAR